MKTTFKKLPVGALFQWSAGHCRCIWRKTSDRSVESAEAAPSCASLRHGYLGPLWSHEPITYDPLISTLSETFQ